MCLRLIGLSAPILQKDVAGGKGDGADNAPIPMPLLSFLKKSGDL